MIPKYPKVVSEDKTLDLILSGKSIARYGDGELRIADHVTTIKNQNADPVLTERLAAILQDSGDCLVGIPNIHAVIQEQVSDQKVEYWTKYLSFRHLLSDRAYVSAFITRPDSAPWINTKAYWAKVQTLWQGQDITIVRGSGKSLTASDLDGARTITEIICAKNSAFTDYDAILARILGTKPTRVLLGLGPTATVLAVDLCARGIHALDLGHLGMFMRKFHRGEPAIVTADDKAVDRVLA